MKKACVGESAVKEKNIENLRKYVECLPMMLDSVKK